MRWTETHDIMFCREILMSKPYQYRPNSKESGGAWTALAEELNAMKEVKIKVSQKSVRDRYRLLLTKYKQKMRNEENASGIDCEETEIDNLLQNIKEESDEAIEMYNNQANEKKEKEEAEKAKAEEVRQLAMENLTQTKKRKSQEEEEPKKAKRNTGTDTIVYLKQRAEQEQELRQQELDLKKQELELQRQQQQQYAQQQNLIVNQLNQNQQMMLALLQKMSDK